MSYVPNPTWTSSTSITSDALNHVQEQYAEIVSYIGSHDHDTRYYTQSSMNSLFWNIDNDGTSSGLDADTLGGSHADAITGGVEPGIAVWYYGLLSDFTNGYLNSDNGWHIADGTDGTVDLMNVFIMGAGGAYAVGASGGTSTFKPAGTISVAGHALTHLEAMHTHALTDYYASNPATGSTNSYPGTKIYYTSNTSSIASITSSVGGGTAHNHPGSFVGNVSSLMPSYLALIPIQKI